jgi:hypothetical protein
MATPRGVSVCRMRMVSPWAASTSGRRIAVERFVEAAAAKNDVGAGEPAFQYLRLYEAFHLMTPVFGRLCRCMFATVDTACAMPLNLVVAPPEYSVTIAP